MSPPLEKPRERLFPFAVVILLLVSAAVFSVVPQAAHATGPSVVQTAGSTTYCNGLSTTCAPAFSSGTAGGNVIVVLVQEYDPNPDGYVVSSIADGGDTFTKQVASAEQSCTAGVYCTAEIWSGSTSGGKTTVTVTFSGAKYSVVQILEVASISASASHTNWNSGANSVPATASTAYGSADFLVASLFASATPTAGAGFTACTTGCNSPARGGTEYEVVSSSGSTTFPWVGSETYWVEAGADFGAPPTVTLPISCTVSESGAPSSSSFTVTGGSPTPSPSTITCSTAGTTTNVVVQGSATITVTGASGTNYRYMFTSSSTTSTTSCAPPGTCPTWSITAEYEVQHTYTATPSVPSVWDAAYTKYPTGTQGGSGGTNLCTLSLTSGGGAASCNGYLDYGATATMPAAIGNWLPSPLGSNTFSDNTLGSTENVNYAVSGSAVSTLIVTVTDTTTATAGYGTVSSIGTSLANWAVFLFVNFVPLAFFTLGAFLMFRGAQAQDDRIYLVTADLVLTALYAMNLLNVVVPFFSWVLTLVFLFGGSTATDAGGGVGEDLA